jgi:uncharacterized protein
LFLRVGDIDAAPVDLEGWLDLSDLLGPDGERLVSGPVEFVGRAQRGSLGVELRARWAATVRQSCSRCLATFESEEGEEFFLILTPSLPESEDPDYEMQAEDADLYPVEGEQAAIREILAEQIQLSLPLKPVCRADCDGLCPTCGVNRNRIECGCRRDEVDPRLAPLRDLKNRLGGG